jgi:asparagine synthase (glutamine-hydrolysing)
MCGLCGILHLGGAPIDAPVAQRLLGALRHRGPDDEGGLWVRDGISLFLGHRRLSIIDLSEAGRQPMLNEDGTVAVIFNGEVYNFAQLREQLIAKGHQFRSQTDTEVVVHLYEEEGPEGVKRLDGMFALALWDQRARQLVLARDRPGKKPLYYYWDDSIFVFASEITAILEHPGVDRGLNPRAVPLYLTYGYMPCPETFYHRIRQVPPGTYVVVRREGISGPIPYWELAFPRAGDELRVSEREARREVRRLLTEAVRKRLVADVPLGAFLSGGIDSSIVVGLMSHLMDQPVKTFTIGFAGADSYDERAYARLVAQQFRTDHTEFVVRPDAISLLEELIEHHGQPFGDSSAIPTYIVAKLTRQHVTVALTGDGGDELFAGYERFLAARVAESVPRPLASLGQRLTGLVPRFNGYGHPAAKLERFLRQAARPLEARYLAWNSFFDRALLSRLLGEDVAASFEGQISESFAACFARSEGCDLLNRLLDLNFRTYLHDDLLVKMDRMTMAHALEARSPFLDTALIEYVAKLPPRLKLKGWKLKYILREAFRDLLPPSIVRRGKHGFGVPLGSWFSGELREYVHDALLGPDTAIRGLLDQNCVRDIYHQHRLGRRDFGHQLWALLTLAVWLRKQQRVRANARLGAGGPAQHVGRLGDGR